MSSYIRILPHETALFVPGAWTSCKSSTDHHSLSMSNLNGSHAFYLTKLIYLNEWILLWIYFKKWIQLVGNCYERGTAI